jgi:hypothetical protein
VDTQPRRLTVDDYRVLNNCAEMVVRRLEAERFAVAHAGAAHTLLRSLEAFKRGVLLCDMAARGWRILYANEAWSKATGAAPCSAGPVRRPAGARPGGLVQSVRPACTRPGRKRVGAWAHAPTGLTSRPGVGALWHARMTWTWS